MIAGLPDSLLLAAKTEIESPQQNDSVYDEQRRPMGSKCFDDLRGEHSTAPPDGGSGETALNAGGGDDPLPEE